jgi:hypothetical protein
MSDRWRAAGRGLLRETSGTPVLWVLPGRRFEVTDLRASTSSSSWPGV